MISPLYFNKKFNSLKEFHHFLKDNQELILEEKKSNIWKSHEKGGGIGFIGYEDNTTEIVKANLNVKKDFVYPIINSTNWLDSHLDVHFKGCYKKTVKEQQGKVYLIDTHQKGLNNIITRKEHIDMFVKDVDWKSLGKDINGETECLVFGIENQHIRPDALDFIKTTSDLECSLAMRYVSGFMAIKSSDSAFKEENELYESYYEQIVNKSTLDRYKFFYGVKELAIMGEGSICPVVGGSNSATRVLINESNEPAKEVTQTIIEPSNDTQKERLKRFLTNVKV